MSQRIPFHNRARRSWVLSLAAIAIFLAIVRTSTALAAGLLVPSDGSDSLRILDHLVNVRIDNGVARTTLNQIFENTSDRRLEATYIFPIPQGADLTDFQMTFNGKMIKGEVLPADEARKIYEDIVRRQRDPGLIEFIGSRLLRARVFPIEPHSKTEIRIAYQQVISPLSGMSHYRYPLRTPGAAGYAHGTVRFNVELETDDPLKAIYSPSHDVEVVREGEHQATVAFEKSGFPLTDDFILLYDVDDQDVGLSLLAHKPEGEDDGHFLLILSPKQLWEDQDPVPQDYVFVVDTSGSMQGEKIEQAKAALKYCIESLDDHDRFSIVRFSTAYDVLFENLRDAGKDAKAKARNAIEDFHASGGTNIYDALEAALELFPEGSDRPFVLVFLTDGLADQSREEIERMLAEGAEDFKAQLRLFPFGVGHDVDTKLLDALATGYGGTPTYVQPGENLEYVLGDFFSVFSQPVLTDLKLELPDAGISEKFPPEPDDLYHGRQLILAGRFTDEISGPITLTGKRGDEEVRYVWQNVSFESEAGAEYVSRLWAGRKIAYLLDRIRLAGETEELKQEVIELGMKYGIQTPYSSWFVNPEDTPAFAGRDVFLGVRGAFSDDEMEAAAAPAAEPSREETGAFRYSKGLGGLTGSGVDLMAAESGELATEVAQDLADLRAGRAGALGSGRHAAVRTINGVTYYNLQGILVDSRFDDEAELLEFKFGSDAYFELLTLRPDLQPVLAASKFALFMADDDLAIAIRDEAGAESLTDQLRERLKSN